MTIAQSAVAVVVPMNVVLATIAVAVVVATAAVLAVAVETAVAAAVVRPVAEVAVDYASAWSDESLAVSVPTAEAIPQRTTTTPVHLRAKSRIRTTRFVVHGTSFAIIRPRLGLIDPKKFKEIA